MNLALFGATGHLGGAILNEALQRGDHVTAIVRDPARLAVKNANLRVVTGDISNPSTYLSQLGGIDTVIASVSGRRDGDAALIPQNAAILLDALPKASVKYLVWIGGAGSLEVAPGKRLVDAPNFPEAYKAEALAQSAALDVFRSSKSTIEWTFVSPAALIEDGARTGTFRIGGDQLLTDANGNSKISVADYAIAIVDRAEKHDKLRQRISVAY